MLARLIVLAFALAALAALGATGALAQSASNVTLVGTVDTPGSAGRVRVAPAGSATYAYVADGEAGVRILDVTDRSQPSAVGSLPSPNSCPAGAPRDCRPAWVASFAASGSVLFRSDSKMSACSMQGCIENPENGLRVFDASNPVSPTEIGFLHTPGQANHVVVEGGYAYLADGAAGFKVVDVSDPRQPRQVYADPLGITGEVALAGGYAYVAMSVDGTMAVYDVRDPSRPARVARVTEPYIPGQPDIPLTGYAVTVAGRYAFVASSGQQQGGHLLVYDVGDPARPTRVGSAATAEHATDVEVAGSYAYVAALGAGLRVFSIADPTAPVEVGFYDTPGTAKAVSLAGGDVFVGDDAAGVQILRFAGASTAGPFRTYLPAVPNGSGWG